MMLTKQNLSKIEIKSNQKDKMSVRSLKSLEIRVIFLAMFSPVFIESELIRHSSKNKTDCRSFSRDLFQLFISLRFGC